MFNFKKRSKRRRINKARSPTESFKILSLSKRQSRLIKKIAMARGGKR
tara:strand:- start:337 stop:480 length:144 start_codon:yes stop_codon:yes gene_type:complete